MGSGLTDLELVLDTGWGTAVAEKLPDLAWEEGEVRVRMGMWVSPPGQHLSDGGGVLEFANEDEVRVAADPGAQAGVRGPEGSPEAV